MRDPAWIAWKKEFLASDGRVIDRLQQSATHSEGQGYGLVLSAYHGDRSAFEMIRGWTCANLCDRADGLLNWKRMPDAATPEAQNATDGDIFFAWGLKLGAERFDIPEAREQALSVTAAISSSCLHPDPRDPSRLVILPAAEGFLRGTKVIVNPSYIMPRALHDLSLLTHDVRLSKAASDGVALLEELAQTQAVPNWAEIDVAGLRPSSEHPAQFGYDAMRVALYLIWSGHRGHAAVRRAADVYGAARVSATPVVVELGDDRATEVSTYPGFAALRDLVCGHKADTNGLDVSQGYYPATLEMLCRVATGETALAISL